MGNKCSSCNGYGRLYNDLRFYNNSRGESGSSYSSSVTCHTCDGSGRESPTMDAISGILQVGAFIIILAGILSAGN